LVGIRRKEQYGINQYGAWMNVMKGHAVANGVYVAAANRIGLEKYLPESNFGAHHSLQDLQGEILRKPLR
jgi:N-carbamoylputrescine amidase